MHMPSELLILFYVFRSAGLIQTLYFRIFCINICKRFAVSSRRFLNPFQSVWFHIETIHLLCRAKQMIGFNMKRNAGLKWVNLIYIHPQINECNCIKSSP